MDVRLSPEQQALRDSVARLVDARAPRSVSDLDDAERAAKLDGALTGAGWRDLRCAADGGEPMATAVDVAIVAEELGRGVADAAFLGPNAAAELRRRAGLETATGTETVVLTADLSGLVTTDGDIRNGAAIDAQGSDTALALARAGDGYAVVQARVTESARHRDLTRVTAPVTGVATRHLAGSQLADHELTAWKAFVLALSCADLVGVMRGAVRLACDYATVRRQYGVPIGSFQSLQHLLADAFVLTEGSASIARHAAWAVDRLPPADAFAAAAAAKAYCARSARTVCETAIQVHGGIGNTWECMAHVFLRRALLSIQVLGDAGVNLMRVISHLGLGEASEHGLR